MVFSCVIVILVVGKAGLGADNKRRGRGMIVAVLTAVTAAVATGT